MTNDEIEAFKAAVDKFLDDAMFMADLEECMARADADEVMSELRGLRGLRGREEEDFFIESNRCSFCGCILANGEIDVCDLCNCGGI